MLATSREFQTIMFDNVQLWRICGSFTITAAGYRGRARIGGTGRVPGAEPLMEAGASGS
jgi:hypothetical protein